LLWNIAAHVVAGSDLINQRVVLDRLWDDVAAAMLADDAEQEVRAALLRQQRAYCSWVSRPGARHVQAAALRQLASAYASCGMHSRAAGLQLVQVRDALARGAAEEAGLAVVALGHALPEDAPVDAQLAAIAQEVCAPANAMRPFTPAPDSAALDGWGGGASPGGRLLPSGGAEGGRADGPPPVAPAAPHGGGRRGSEAERERGPGGAGDQAQPAAWDAAGRRGEAGPKRGRRPGRAREEHPVRNVQLLLSEKVGAVAAQVPAYLRVPLPPRPALLDREARRRAARALDVLSLVHDVLSAPASAVWPWPHRDAAAVAAAAAAATARDAAAAAGLPGQTGGAAASGSGNSRSRGATPASRQRARAPAWRGVLAGEEARWLLHLFSWLARGVAEPPPEAAPDPAGRAAPSVLEQHARLRRETAGMTLAAFRSRFDPPCPPPPSRRHCRRRRACLLWAWR